MVRPPAFGRRGAAAGGTPARRRVRVAPLVLLAAVATSAVVAMTVNQTMAGFTAQITNNNNVESTGVLTMSEVQGGTTCTSNSGGVSSNAVTCAINKYNGATPLVPGTAVTATVTLKNTGTVTANTFNLTPGTCAQSNSGSVNGTATDLCSKVTLSVTQDANPTPVLSGTLTAIASTPVTFAALPANTTTTFTFSVTLSSSADNTYQGLQVNQNLVWKFAS